MVDDDAPRYEPGPDEGRARSEGRDLVSLAVADAAGELQAVRTGAKVLKAVAAIAFGLWVLALVSVFWNWWQLSDTGASSSTLGITTGSMDNERILQVLSTTLTSTWGYLLAAVLAYGGSMALHAQRMRLLVDAVAADD